MEVKVTKEEILKLMKKRFTQKEFEMGCAARYNNATLADIGIQYNISTKKLRSIIVKWDSAYVDASNDLSDMQRYLNELELEVVRGVLLHNYDHRDIIESLGIQGAFIGETLLKWSAIHRELRVYREARNATGIGGLTFVGINNNISTARVRDIVQRWEALRQGAISLEHHLKQLPLRTQEIQSRDIVGQPEPVEEDELYTIMKDDEARIKQLEAERELLIAQNVILMETMRFYANVDNYFFRDFTSPFVITDDGKQARRCLEALENLGRGEKDGEGEENTRRSV